VNVGQFSSTHFLKPIVRWEVHGTDLLTLLANQILVTSKITLLVTVSIRDLLPLLMERNENNVRSRVIVKLNVNNYRCKYEEMTSAMMEWWKKACQRFIDLASRFESHR